VDVVGGHGRRCTCCCGRSLAGGFLGCVGGAGFWESGQGRQIGVKDGVV
jgi:hypothetical protein